MVGELFDTEVGHIGHHHAQLCRIVNGYIIKADPVAADVDTFGRRVEYCWGHLLPAGENRVGLWGQGDQFGFVTPLGDQEFNAKGREDCLFTVERWPGVVGDQDGVGGQRVFG